VKENDSVSSQFDSKSIHKNCLKYLTAEEKAAEFA
jgi:hypothetical protein